MQLNLVAEVSLDVNGNPSAVKVYDPDDPMEGERVWWYFSNPGDNLIVTRIRQ
jgi:hypothetical protein